MRQALNIMTTRKTILTLAILMTGLALSGQEYNFSYDTENFKPLTDATDLTGGEPWDFLHFVVPLEHEFEFYGKVFDTIHVRGYVHFDQADTWFINPFYTSFADRGDSPVLYRVDGDEGNRITMIEWKNMGFRGEKELLGTTDDFINFQLWLYEATNNIRIYVGPGSITHPDTSYYGNPGPAVGVYHIIQTEPETLIESYSLSGDPASPSVVINDPLLNVYLEGTPAGNTMYRFAYVPGGMGEYHENNRLILYPVPAGNHLYFETSFTSQGVNRYLIMSTDGRTVKTETCRQGRIDVGSLSPGFYKILLWNSKEKASGSFIKK